MKKLLLIGSIALVVILALAACAPGQGQPQPGGMMDGQGGVMGPPDTPGVPGSSQQPYSYGPGGMMGPGMMGPGMMGSGGMM